MSTNTFKVLILLSTYNGENYITEQLYSLLQQKGVNIHILIRDDGSTDSTVPIIEKLAETCPEKINFWADANIGVKRSYFTLLQRAYESYKHVDYFAFCDQDDVWNDHKLIHAIHSLNLEDRTIPLLYCSTTQMVDSNLNELAVWPKSPRKALNTFNAIVENVVVGCTSVINQTALQLLATNPPTHYEKIIMHDWWVYLCISSFGQVVFDREPKILYRQHANNVLGGQKERWFIKWKKRLYRYIRGQNHFIISNQAREFAFCFYHKLDRRTQSELMKFIQASEQSIFKRIQYASRTPLYRQSITDHLIMKLLIIMGKI